jgi:DNA-binding MarR family transcriptional regulator
MTGTPASDALHAIETEMAVLARALELLSRRGQIHRRMDRSGYLLLRTLEDAGPLGINSLAERVGLDASTVTRQVDCLEREGFAHRRPCATDRRSSLVEPSGRGRRLMLEVQRQRRTKVDAVLAGWSEAERADLARMLARLNRAIAADPVLRGDGASTFLGADAPGAGTAFPPR